MRKKLIVLQHDIRDCGPCALLSIIRFYDGDIPLEKIKFDAKTSINGTTAYNLILVARKYGFSAEGIRINLSDINNISLPAIAHVRLDNGLEHYVVLYEINKTDVSIMDPSHGYKKIKIDEFLKIWTNVLIIMSPNGKIPLISKNATIRDLFMNVLVNEKKFVFKILFNSLFITIMSLLISYYFQIIMNLNNYNNYMYYVMLLFLMIYILKIYFNYVRNEYIIYINKNIDLNLIFNFIKHIFNLPLYVIKGRSSGEVITRVYDLNNIKELFSEIFISIFLDFIIFFTSTSLLYSINKTLFLILCLIAIIYVLLGFIINPFIIRRINNNIDLHTDFNSSLIEKINSILSIKNLNIFSWATNNLLEQYSSYVGDSVRYQKFINKYSLIKDIISEIGLFIITSLGLIMIYHGQLDLIYLITFNSLVSYFFDPVKNSMDLLPKFNLIKLSILKVEEFINIDEEKIGEIEQFIDGDITISNLSYSYDNYYNIIDNLNINISKGSHICFRGKSGCGKSTVCQCLNRNIDDYKGNIYIKDISIKDYSLNTIRSNILYVSQKESLYSDSIINNIVLNSKVSKEELNEVLKVTCVDEILKKKKMSVNTCLIDGGLNLSGGERQRIILARALVQNPSILILDESLSEVGYELERQIMSNIDLLYKDKTIIYVSHSNLKVFRDEIIFRSGNERIV